MRQMKKKQKVALDCLREHRNEMNQMMGMSNQGRPYRQIPKDTFLNLVEYMEINDDKGLYSPILQKVLRREIQNADDLKNFIRNNDSNGKYDELQKQIKNPNLEMKNLLRWLEMNNQDGKYNSLIEEMKRNPHFNKIDATNFLDNNNSDGQYDDLRRKLDFASQGDELIDYLKKVNKNGVFDPLIESQKGGQ